MVRAWMLLGVGALALAGLFALLLAWSRVPGAQDAFAAPIQFFRKGLVIHVVFSFVVWFLAAFGAFAALAVVSQKPEPAALALGMLRGGLGFAVVALPLLFAPAFLASVEPTLNNYIPVLVHPAYYGGLATLAAGIALAAFAVLGSGWRPDARPFDGARFATMAAALAFLAAVACVLMARAALGSEPLSFGFNEDLFWAGGHTLQFMNIALLVAAWAVLASPRNGPAAAAAGGRAFVLAALLAALGALAGVVLFLATPPFSALQTLAYTDLQYALAPAPLIAAFGALQAWRAAGRPAPTNPAWLSIALSLLLFLVGGAMGLVVDGADTRTPAHYHAVIAAVNVALMGAFHIVLVPATGATPVASRWVRWQILLFGGGQTVASIGLFWAGGYGAPRKAAGAEQGLQHLGEFAGLALNGIGALVAAMGGVWFVVSIARAVLRRQSADSA